MRKMKEEMQLEMDQKLAKQMAMKDMEIHRLQSTNKDDFQ